MSSAYFEACFIRLNAANENFKTAPIIVGNNVSIGSSSIILKGVEIGENPVIGAGSAVTKKISANEIWAGNPAHFIKKPTTMSEKTQTTKQYQKKESL